MLLRCIFWGQQAPYVTLMVYVLLDVCYSFCERAKNYQTAVFNYWTNNIVNELIGRGLVKKLKERLAA